MLVVRDIHSEGGVYCLRLDVMGNVKTDARSHDLTVKKDANAFLKALGGAQLLHFDDEGIQSAIDAWLKTHGLTPLDVPIFDLAPLAGHLYPDDATSNVSLDALAERNGAPLHQREAADKDPVSRLWLIQSLLTSFLLPSLPKLHGRSSVDRTGRRATSTPLPRIARPRPSVPSMEPPTGGWRTTPWSSEEELGVADFFLKGQSLAWIAETTRRAPEAVLLCLEKLRVVAAA